MSNVAIETHNLFATPIWTVSLAHLAPHVEAMIEDSIEAIQGSPARKGPFEQSDGMLQTLDGSHWSAFFEAYSAVAESIIHSAMDLSFERFALRSWALRIRNSADYRTETTAIGLAHLHSHVHCVLSSVFYLRVPEGLSGSADAGTLFRDPGAAVASHLRASEYLVPAEPLCLVLFPSFLEHAPCMPADYGGEDGPRLIVATDLAVADPAHP